MQYLQQIITYTIVVSSLSRVTTEVTKCDDDQTCCPVSYTHLDVYKRQIIHTTLGLRACEK